MLLLLLLAAAAASTQLTPTAATVKDLRRQVSDFKSEIIKLQDSLKSRDVDLAEALRKVQELDALAQMQVSAVVQCIFVTFDVISPTLNYCNTSAGASPRPPHRPRNKAANGSNAEQKRAC